MVGVFGEMKQYSFDRQLKFSEGISVSGDIFKRLLQIIPESNGIVKANQNDDRNGTDYWINRHRLPPLSIDVKHRSFCPIIKYGSDDACIETTSVYRGSRPPWSDTDRKKIGWTLNGKKRTDFILYTWPHDEYQLRYWLVNFPLLCKAAQNKWREWAAIYKERSAQNDGYLTLSIYPPRNKIASAIRDLTRGIA